MLLTRKHTTAGTSILARKRSMGRNGTRALSFDLPLSEADLLRSNLGAESRIRPRLLKQWGGGEKVIENPLVKESAWN